MIFPQEFESKIGFDQIREKLKSYCLSPLGMTEVDGLGFLTDYSSVKELLDQSHEFKKLLIKAEPFPASNYFDPTDLFQTIKIEESFIEENGFRIILLSLQTIFDCKQFLDKSKEAYPNLYQLSIDINLPKNLLSSIQSKFDEKGKIRDNATPELNRIRRQLREEEGKVRRLTEQIFRSAASQSWVPEGASPTIREGRLVIPVLAEHKRKVKGFIVDESATGQTIYLEPTEVLEANNEIRDLFHAERREVIKILKELTTLLRQHLPDLQKAYWFLGKIDFIRAKAKFSMQIDAELPMLSRQPELNWLQARHPLLQLSFKADKKVIPLDIELNIENRFLLVSGPNAGGKSVCLKTVGLIQYMAQCGLLVPVYEKSTIGIFKGIFLDIGDQQSLENDLSTYSSHLKNMSFFLGNASADTLVLMDELGSGTDPNFGGGIAEAILDGLLARKVWGVATTHYYNLKLFAENGKGIRNAYMQFDTKKLQPLFLLEVGKPGSSFALEIARKTGLPNSTLDRAEQIIGKELTGLETLMKTVAEERIALTKREREFQLKEKELTDELARYRKLSDEIESKKKEIINKAKLEATYLLKETNREIEKTIRHIQENKAEKKETRKVRTGLQELADKVKPDTMQVASVKPELIKEGDHVRLIGQEVSGTVISIKGISVVVQYGNMRANLKMDQLVRSDLAEVPESVKKARSYGLDVFEKQSTFSSTLDIRGKRVEEVEPLLGQFLDDAILLSQGQLKILHGKGEGVLRKVVRERLNKIKEVASFQDDHADRGGEGVTLVVLK